jgi:hypothetical protein
MTVRFVRIALKVVTKIDGDFVVVILLWLKRAVWGMMQC